MKRELELYFLTNENKKTKVVVPEPKPDVTQAEINSVMDLIINKNLFGFPQGVAVSKVEARIVETNVQKIDL
ncbi:MAG: DUF2922 domain-containing protein [Tumebacillaceae bacterium]